MNQAKRLPVGRGAYPTAGLGGRYFADWVLDQVGSTIGYVDRDLIVTTTLDPRLQRMAEGEVEAILAKYSDKREVNQAALIALGPDGRVVAMVGGRDYRESQFNRATQALRQPGSAFKPFVYLAGLSNGLTPSTPISDDPISIAQGKGQADWTPGNYDGTSLGVRPMRVGLEQSRNTMTVQIGRAHV